jgi:hypothetical protein
MLDAGVSLRGVQIAARHADPRTTMRYDRARKNLDGTRITSSPPTWRPAHSQPPRSLHDHADDSAFLRSSILRVKCPRDAKMPL